MEPSYDTQDAVSTLSLPGALKLEISDTKLNELLSYPLREEVLFTGKDACILKVVSQHVAV